MKAKPKYKIVDCDFCNGKQNISIKDRSKKIQKLTKDEFCPMCDGMGKLRILIKKGEGDE